MSNTNRSVIISTDEEEEALYSQLIRVYVTNNGLEDVEPWFDSEFNRIFIAYMYPDVTKTH
jgi:hypothetical protein